MAYELDSEMLGRLQSQYGAMSDGELLELVAKPDDLTDMALEVLRGEMTRRNLKAAADLAQAAPVSSGRSPQDEERGAWSESAIPVGILGSAPTLDMAVPEDSSVAAGETLLGRFHDAIEVGRACQSLEQHEVEFRLVDVAKPRSGTGMYDSPPVALDLIVAKADRERAMAVLRKEMGLFPLQEVEEADAEVDDGTLATLGDFGRREDAEAVARILQDAGVWHRVSANAEGSVEGEDAFTLEVKEVDLMKAGDVVEKAMG
jgi:hypothetical protein